MIPNILSITVVAHYHDGVSVYLSYDIHKTTRNAAATPIGTAITGPLTH